MTQTFNVGIVGCGEATQILHLPSLNQLHEQFQVKALCDLSQTVLDGVGKQWGIAQRYLNYQDLLTQPDIEIVLIANPDAYHAEVALAAITAGKHVLIEKPMCMTLAEADAIISAQQQANVIVQVGYMRRYAPAFIAACQRLPELGPIRLARVHDVLGSNALFIQDTSRVIRANDIAPQLIEAAQQQREASIKVAIGDTPAELRRAYGLLLGLGSHDISAMRELLGRPRRVLYAAQRWGGGYLSAAFDYGDYICHYETGTDRIPRFDAYLDVYGEQQTMRIKYDTPYVRNLPIYVSHIQANDSGGVIQHSENPAWGDAFVAEWRAFYENIIKQKIPKTSPADFRNDLELFIEMIGQM